MKLLSMTAAALIASCALANAQATNMSPTPGDAKSLSGSGSDVRDYRSDRRRAVRQRNSRVYRHHYRHHRPAYVYRDYGWDGYAYEPGWHGPAFGVHVGPFGFGGPYYRHW